MGQRAIANFCVTVVNISKRNFRQHQDISVESKCWSSYETLESYWWTETDDEMLSLRKKSKERKKGPSL